jgi:hypothetical protein
MILPGNGALEIDLEAMYKKCQTAAISVYVHQGMFLETITAVLKNLREEEEITVR